MYKYISFTLIVLLAVGGVFYGVERYQHSKTKLETNNQIAKLEGTVKETESAYSRRAFEIEDLETENDELQDLVDGRDEEIFALGRISVEWQDKYFKIKNARQTYVGPTGEPILPDSSDPTEDFDIDDCDEDTRIKVEFESVEDAVTVSGFTLTNPAYAEVSFVWNGKFNLDIILTKGEDGHFRIYVDPEGSSSVPMELDLVIDPSVLARAWYENIAFNALMAGGSGGALVGVGAHYDILPNFYLGPMLIFGLTDEGRPKIYGGVVAAWYPWRRE